MPIPTLLKGGSGLEYQPIPNTPIVLHNSVNRPRMILTTVKIPDESVWANGLFQNVYILYKMFDSMGFEPWLLVEDNSKHTDAKVHSEFRILDFGMYINNPFPIVSYIEVAMSCSPEMREIFRKMGAKISKTYLGNILNIDVETTTFFSTINFSHHIAGAIDEIFVSPHYDIHAEYAASINGLCKKTRIAPYVWDPYFIEQSGVSYNGSNILESTPRTFLIMEPNISFQKNALIPIMAMEAYYRKFPDRVENVVVINGKTFQNNPYFSSSILPYLTLATSGKLHLMPRSNIIDIAKEFTNAIILQHQVNNSYNYTFMEWITMGYPLIHNIERFKEYGYYYPENNFDIAETQIESIVSFHETNKYAYRSQVEQLAWTFSIHNPANTEMWRILAIERV